MAEIIQNNGEKFGEFSARYEEQSAGVLQYEWKDENTFDIVHTEVDDTFEGKGIGTDLVKSAVEFARKEGKKIEASCPFAKSVLEENDSYKDIYKTN